MGHIESFVGHITHIFLVHTVGNVDSDINTSYTTSVDILMSTDFYIFIL